MPLFAVAEAILKKKSFFLKIHLFMCAWHTNVGAGCQKGSDALALVGTRELPDLGAGN